MPGGAGSAPTWPAGLTVFCCLDGVHDLRHGDVQLGELVRLHPQAHGVLPGAEHHDARDPGHARQLVVQVDVGVVGQEGRVVAPARRGERHQHERRGGGLFDRDPVVAHLGRQLRVRLRFPYLRQHLGDVGVDLDVEVHVQLQLAVVGVERVHVVHVVHPAHLLLDGGGHRLLDGLGVGADVGGVDVDLGRHDVRVLGGRQPEHSHDADDDGDDGDHDRHDRPVDEELCHKSTFPPKFAEPAVDDAPQREGLSASRIACRGWKAAPTEKTDHG